MRHCRFVKHWRHLSQPMARAGGRLLKTSEELGHSSGSFRLSLDIEYDCLIDFCKLPTCQTLNNLTPIKKLEY